MAQQKANAAGKIAVTCSCGKRLFSDPSMAGKQGQCPSCKGLLYIPAAKSAATPPTIEPPPHITPPPDRDTFTAQGLTPTQVADLPVGGCTSPGGNGPFPQVTSLTKVGGLSLTQQVDLPMATQFAGAGGPARAAALGHRGRLPPGEQLVGRYTIRRLVGQGGMGEVYAALDQVRGEEVALKFLRPALAARPDDRRRFIQEGLVATKCSHPNIARIYDLQQTDQHVFLSMELLHGNSLRAEMQRRAAQGHRFTIQEVVLLLKQMCEALGYIHQELIHRDVKPENVWICQDGQAKLMDFGIARQVNGLAFTQAGSSSGSAYYMAPEQLRGSSQIDGRADQYAVGVIVYELLTGQLPQGAARAPHELDRQVPQCLSQAVMRALSMDPGQRHATMTGFYADASRALTRRARPGMPRVCQAPLVAAARLNRVVPIWIITTLASLLIFFGLLLGGFFRATPSQLLIAKRDPAVQAVLDTQELNRRQQSPQQKDERHANGNLKSRQRYYLDLDGKEVPHGAAEVFYENGRTQASGDYKDGQRDGPWKCWHESGAVWTTAQYSAGKPTGEWTYFDKDSKPIGKRLDGVKTGPWRETDTSRETLAAGEYRQGQRQREWVFSTASGRTLLTVEYQDGEVQGNVTVDMPDGKAKLKLFYDQGRELEPRRAVAISENGKTLTYTAKSPRYAEVMKKAAVPAIEDLFWQPELAPVDPADTLVVRQRHENGKPSLEYELRIVPGVLDAVRHGTASRWSDTGKRLVEQHFDNGQRHGAFQASHADGTQRYRIQFEHGRPTGDWTFWYANGKPEGQGNADDLSTWSFFEPDGSARNVTEVREWIKSRLN